MPVRNTLFHLVILGCAVVPLSGCLERTIRVTSEPPGALVWLNDTEIGRTPAEARLKFYGTYDVRLELAGYEPVHEGREAVAPFYEYPGPDAIASAIPVRIHNRIDWHFDLLPSAGSGDRAAEADLLARAHALRDQLGPAPLVPTQDEPAPEADPSSNVPATAAPETPIAPSSDP